MLELSAGILRCNYRSLGMLSELWDVHLFEAQRSSVTPDWHCLGCGKQLRGDNKGSLYEVFLRPLRAWSDQNGLPL
jgi:hypothetical protein